MRYDFPRWNWVGSTLQGNTQQRIVSATQRRVESVKIVARMQLFYQSANKGVSRGVTYGDHVLLPQRRAQWWQGRSISE